MKQATKFEVPATGRLPQLRFSLLALWGMGVVFAGAVLTSQHQPFRVADKIPLALFRHSASGHWRVIHVLSGSCGCSQKIMAHLALRRPLRDFEEEVTVVDDGIPYLPDSDRLLVLLQRDEFPVRHIRLEDLPRGAGLNGVPMLVVASPSGQIAYAGGYGTPENDVKLLHSVRTGRRPELLPVIGCAVGRALQRKVDPFRLKYSDVQSPQAPSSTPVAGLSIERSR